MSLRLLGSPAILSDGKPVPGFPAKAYVIAALLLLAGKASLSRASLAGTLYEDSDDAVAGSALRQLLLRVRRFEQRLGRPVFKLEGDQVALDDTAGTWDVQALQSVAPLRSEPELKAVLDLWAGELLLGIDGDGADLSYWIDLQRNKVREKFSDLLLDAAEHITGPETERALRRLAESSSLDDTTARALMTHLIARGRLIDARRTYLDFARRLSEALQIIPEAETTALFQSIGAAIPAAPIAPQPLPERAEAGRSLAGAPRVALLMPVLDPDAAANQNHFAAALVEDVTIGMTRLRSMSVIASHSAAQLTRPVVAGALPGHGIDYAMKTRIGPDPASSDPNAQRLTAMLERVQTGEVLWADKFRFAVDDGPERYRDLTNSITRILADKVEQAEMGLAGRTDSATAYAQFLLGQHHIRTMDLPDQRRARRHFRRALEIAPDFAPAHSGLAATNVYEWVITGGNDARLLDNARANATRAMEIDPLDADAHRALGRAVLFQGDMDASLEHFDMAEERAPNHADMLCDFADTLTHAAKAELANDKIEHAIHLNPLAPDPYWWASGGAKFFLGRYSDALAHLDNMTNRDSAWRLIAACAAMAGDDERAAEARRQSMALVPDFTIAAWLAVVPIETEEYRQHYVEALIRAGFK